MPVRSLTPALPALLLLASCAPRAAGGDEGSDTGTEERGSDDEIGEDELDSSESGAESSSESGSGSSSDAGPTDSDSDSSSEDSAEETDTGGGESGDACFDTIGFAIANMAEDLVYVHEPGGELHVLDVSGPLGVGNGYLGLEANEDVVFVGRQEGVFVEDAYLQSATLRLFPRHAQAPAWEHHFDAATFGGLRWLLLDEDDRPVVGTHTPRTFAFDDAGGGEATMSEVPLDGFWIYPGTFADGWVPGHLDGELGFATLDGGFDPVMPHEGWRSVHDGFFERLPDGSAVFERGNREQVDAFELPVAPEDWSFSQVAGDFRLLGHVDGPGPDGLVHHRLDITDGSVLAIEPDYPPGLEPFTCGRVVYTQLPDGRVATPLRDADSATLFAWDPDSDEWAPLGDPITGVNRLSAFMVAPNTLLLRGEVALEPPCQQSAWSAPPDDALVGDSVQFVRLDPPASLQVDVSLFPYASPSSWLWIDTSERCIASPNDEGMHIFDIDSGESLSLEHSGRLTWLP